MTVRVQYISIIACFLMLIASCQKDEVPPNPFDPYNNPPEDSTNTSDLDPNSIAGIYKNVFQPTCANSGCHDGTFEPDFRSIENSYNSLIYVANIKQDASDPLDYRVVPNSSTTSMLIRRLTQDIGGNSGIMPLSVDPASDWDANKDAYIQNIRNWIDNGAPDMFGNVPNDINQVPYMTGFFATRGTNNIALDRTIEGAIIIPANAQSIKVYVALSDRESAASELSNTELLLSKARDDFSQATSYPLQMVTPVTEVGYDGTNTGYQFQATVNDPLNIYTNGDQVFARVTVKDPQHELITIPGDWSIDHIKRYFSFEVE